MQTSTRSALGLFAIRLGLAAVFLGHGISKLATIEKTIGFFDTLGLPAFVAYLVAIGETLGGLSMLLGLWTGISGIGLAIIMAGAIALVKFSKGWMGFEFEAMLLLAAVGIALAGPGSWALGKKRHATTAPASPSEPPPKKIA